MMIKTPPTHYDVCQSTQVPQDCKLTNDVFGFFRCAVFRSFDIQQLGHQYMHDYAKAPDGSQHGTSKAGLAVRAICLKVSTSLCKVADDAAGMGMGGWVGSMPPPGAKGSGLGSPG